LKQAPQSKQFSRFDNLCKKHVDDPISTQLFKCRKHRFTN